MLISYESKFRGPHLRGRGNISGPTGWQKVVKLRKLKFSFSEPYRVKSMRGGGLSLKARELECSSCFEAACPTVRHIVVFDYSCSTTSICV